MLVQSTSHHNLINDLLSLVYFDIFIYNGKLNYIMLSISKESLIKN